MQNINYVVYIVLSINLLISYTWELRNLTARNICGCKWALADCLGQEGKQKSHGVSFISWKGNWEIGGIL